MVATTAVAYYRMSSDDQEDGIEQQRKEVEAFAKRNGYTIVEEYVDEGKSGSKDIEKRFEFARMLSDAKVATWKHILCGLPPGSVGKTR